MEQQTAPVPLYAFGQAVTIKVNNKPATGVVTWSFDAGNNQTCYHVRDEYGNYWHRAERELSAVAA